MNLVVILCAMFCLFIHSFISMKSSRILLYELSDGIRREIEHASGTSPKNDLYSLVNSATNSVDVHGENSLLHFACSMCHKVFDTLEEQKIHFKSEQHLKLLRQSLKKGEEDSDSSDSDEDDSMEVIEEGCLLSLVYSFGRMTMYKRILESGYNNREVAVSQLPTHLDGHFCIILYRSGYFILGIYNKGQLLLSRQEKRYTTRRKQGGAQRKKDNSSGKAISMGARLRRHNEELMQEFVSLEMIM